MTRDPWRNYDWRNYDRLRTESPEDRDERLREQFAEPDPDDVADYLDALEAKAEQDRYD